MNRIWAILVLISLFMFSACSFDLDAEVDRDLFIVPDDFDRFGYDFPRGDRYEQQIEVSFGLVRDEIQFRYSAPASDERPRLALQTTVIRVFDPFTARIEYETQRLAFITTLTSTHDGITLVPAEADFPKFGDNSYTGFIHYNGIPAGQVFTVRDGSRVYLSSIVGLYFDDHDDWRQFIEPKLMRLSEFGESSANKDSKPVDSSRKGKSKNMDSIEESNTDSAGT